MSQRESTGWRRCTSAVARPANVKFRGLVKARQSPPGAVPIAEPWVLAVVAHPIM